MYVYMRVCVCVTRHSFGLRLAIGAFYVSKGAVARPRLPRMGGFCEEYGPYGAAKGGCIARPHARSPPDCSFVHPHISPIGLLFCSIGPQGGLHSAAHSRFAFLMAQKHLGSWRQSL